MSVTRGGHGVAFLCAAAAAVRGHGGVARRPRRSFAAATAPTRRAVSAAPIRASAQGDLPVEDSPAAVGRSSALDEPPTAAAGGRIFLKSLSFAQLEEWLASSLGERRFRAQQLWRWMYRAAPLAADFDDMTDLSLALRSRLRAVARVDALELVGERVAADGTRKLQFGLHDGGVVETVWIPHAGGGGGGANDDDEADGGSQRALSSSPSPGSSPPPRVTLCVSSQLGCAMNCQFCFTARMGLRRQLSRAEIVDQVVQARRRLDGDTNGRVSNVVFMGMGEPLHNPDEVIAAVNVLTSPTGLGMSHNKVTVSTSGLVPAIRRFLAESPACLAVSLNASTDEVRDWIMPINRKYNIATLLQTLREHLPRRADGRAVKKVFIEYVLLRGVNDSLDDAKRLVKLLARLPCKVNLINFNSHHGSEFQASPAASVRAFSQLLSERGVRVTVRQSRGDDEMAACGQLGRPGDRPEPPRTRPPGAAPPPPSAGARRRANAPERRESRSG